VQGFLALIRQGETNQTDDAYRMCFGGSLFDAPPWVHPNTPITKGSLTSTAAGAYQFLASTWKGLVAQYHFEDFSPANQDLGAIALIAGRKALAAVKAGDIHAAIRLCGQEWASLPGSQYGQPTQKLSKALEVYRQAGGALSEPADPPPVKAEVKMPAALLAFLPEVLKLIPALGGLFGSGSEVSNRNLAAAQVVGDTLVKATQAVNVQDAVEKMQADPTILADRHETRFTKSSRN
jgi:muramidase (phage lysozyme)